MEPIIDHIQITVKDMSIAVPFYDKLMPLLGFDIKSKTNAAPSSSRIWRALSMRLYIRNAKDRKVIGAARRGRLRSRIRGYPTA